MAYGKFYDPAYDYCTKFDKCVLCEMWAEDDAEAFFYSELARCFREEARGN